MRLSNPTGRNTRAHRVDTSKASFFFSYETCIAVRWEGKGVRIANSWGPTTGRHFNELGVSDLPVISSDAFDKIVEKLS